MSSELFFALVTAAAVCAVTWPLVRRAGRAGSVTPESKAATQSDAWSTLWRRRGVLIASLAALAMAAGGLYLKFGSPELGVTPFAGEHNPAPDQQSVQNLVAQAEAHLQRDPGDGHGWEILGPVYMRLNRYSDAVTAWNNALQILGESAERDANLGEALTAEANDVVTADAKAAFERALALDKTSVTARYYLGLAAEQDGQREQAAKIWSDLLADAPADAFWVGDVRKALARVQGGSASPSGPQALQAGTADQPTDRQAAMIQGMVDRLASRLKQDGSDVDGWIRLVRSYKVLKDPEKARAAAAEAQQALAQDPGKLKQFNAALEALDSGNPAPATLAAGPVAAPSAAADQHQQGATMESMLERLAGRLRLSGADPEGWLTLVRSYDTLGEKDKARAAVKEARDALAADPGKLDQFNAALKNFKFGD